MFSYAHTSIQLVSQLRREGYSTYDIGFMMKVYKLAVSLLTGLFERSGDSSLSHGIGTASILCSLHAPAELMATALMHNVYRTGDFGDGRKGRKGLSDSRRKKMRNSVGDEVEDYLYRFFLLKQMRRGLPAYLTASRNDLAALSESDRKVCLLALADQLEHHLDLARIYDQRDIGKCRDYIHRYGDAMVELAEKLGFPGLAGELARAFRETESAEVPQELLTQVGYDHPFVVARKSWRRRLFDLFQRSRPKKPSPP